MVAIGSRPSANANGPDVTMLILEPERHRAAAPKSEPCAVAHRGAIGSSPMGDGSSTMASAASFEMSRSVWAFCSSCLNRAFYAARPRLAELPYPAAQLRLVDAQFRRDIDDRQPALPDALHGLPLELIRKIPALRLLQRTLLPLARKPIMGVHSIRGRITARNRPVALRRLSISIVRRPGAHFVLLQNFYIAFVSLSHTGVSRAVS